MSRDIALITGASSGIGAALARRVALERRDVALVARRADRLAVLARELETDHGVSAHVIARDLAQPGAVAAVLDELARRDLNVDWLFNNAGIGHAGRFDRIATEKVLEEVRIDVEVLVELTSRCLPGMVRQGRGAVVNISSLGAYSPCAYMATYVAAKAFVLSLTESIAEELRGTGVHALCVCPGFTRTEFQKRANVSEKSVPKFLWMSAEEVADQTVRSIGKRSVLVPGALNTLAVWSAKITPRRIQARLGGSLVKPA